MVKARNHVPQRFDTAIFDAPEQAAALVEQTVAEGGEPLLQTPLQGTMGAVVIVAGRDGEIITEIHQEAVRTWPPGAGDTVLGRVIAPDPELSRGIARLVAELGWQGPRPDRAVPGSPTAPLSITDFNGRFYGSMALAPAAGVNMPAIWARDALGLDPWGGGPPREARIGARFQWLNRDLPAGWARGPAGLANAIAAAPFAAHSMWTVRTRFRRCATWCRRRPAGSSGGEIVRLRDGEPVGPEVPSLSGESKSNRTLSSRADAAAPKRCFLKPQVLRDETDHRR